MNDFSVTFWFETPLLQSGARPKVNDRSGPNGRAMVRMSEMKGLMHTFGRALIGPWVGADVSRTKSAEQQLLGAEGDPASGGGPTFRLEDASHDGLSGSAALNRGRPGQGPGQGDEKFPNCPHEPGKGDREGHAPDPNHGRRLVVRPRPAAVEADPLLPAALFVVLWTAMTLGALGNRSRRGYGSMTIGPQDRESWPALDGLLERAPAGVARELPIPDQEYLPTREELAAYLKRGLETASWAIGGWLGQRAVVVPSFSAPPARTSFFQVAWPGLVYVGGFHRGPESRRWEGAMRALMQACSDAQRSDAPLFARTVGSAGQAGGGRLASPLFVRLCTATELGQEGFIPVAVHSPFSTSPRDTEESVSKLARLILGKIGAEPLTELLRGSCLSSGGKV